MKEKTVLHNEDGSVLVIALVMLALLVVIGISATTTSNIESLVTRNVEDYTVALYLAEAAAMEAVQSLDDVTPNPRANPPSWLNPTVDAVTDANIVDPDYWAGGAPFPPDPGGIGNSTLLAGSHGVVRGSSLDMGKSNVYGYTAYGRGQSQTGGVVIIGVGYRRAF
jgi:Tfp pilus assembly protein PilX